MTTKVIYKINGHTFRAMWEVKRYMDDKHFIETDRETFEYKGTIVICINVTSR